MNEEKKSIGTFLWEIIEKIVRGVFGLIFKIFHIDFSEEKWEALLQFVRFGIVGVWNTIFSFLINLGCLKLFQRTGILADVVFGTPMRVYVANIIAWIISVFVSFILNNKFVFTVEEGQQRSFFKSLMKSYVSYGFTGLILNNLLAILWVGVCGIPEEIAPLLSLIISIPVNFILNKLWAFKTE
ncbi:GtrA family protein [Eubacterium xylanophilum]|uniref:GtrA family protein n=1 Tax=Eubacterium xylanophilum TaxID=39497 RepID=UPI00047EA1D0|nr:GtrA family protein [Eubacterium xylanophilum]MCR5797373.1 GtrA family protein [Eubacterium sp.]